MPRISMPKLSPTMSEGTVAAWHKQEGDFVEEGELLVEIVTDKATIEYSMLDPGWLRQIIVPTGATAAVGEPIAIYTENLEDAIDASVPSSLEKPLPTKTCTKREACHSASIASTSSRVKASPFAKKLAHERNIALDTLVGSGPNGRIMSRDLPDVQHAPSASIIALTPMRKTIAARLQYAKSTIPHFYLQTTVNVTQLLALRETLKKEGSAITINDFILKATSLALMEHPSLRATFHPERDEIEQYAHADICVAVAIPGGLITPIIESADTLPLQQLSSQAKAIADKAKSGKLQLHEYTGGCFTISNLGMFGIDEFYAIINPPQVAILAVGAAKKTALAVDAGIMIASTMRLTLSVDHRAVDGAQAAQFLQHIQSLLERPSTLLS